MTMRRITFCRNNVPQTQVDKSIKRVIPIRRHKSLINTHTQQCTTPTRECVLHAHATQERAYSRALGIDNIVGFLFLCKQWKCNEFPSICTPLSMFLWFCAVERAFWRWDLDYDGLTTKWKEKCFPWTIFLSADICRNLK